MHQKIQLLLCTLLFQCGSIISQTITQEALIHDGLERSYRTYIPAIYDGTEAVPLVINMHGYGSNSLEQYLYGTFAAIADTANFIVVHPDGTLDNLQNQYWNSFGLSEVDDIGFLSALIDTILVTYNVDPNCIYSTGMSNGGFMSYTLACELSERIAAIASVTGTMVVGQLTDCNAQHPTPVMQIHGTNDATVPYNGSSTMEAIDDVVAYWVGLNNCASAPTITDVPNTNTTDNCTAEHHIYTGGDNNSSVELYKIIGGGHSWPGAIFNINTTNMDFNASKEIWRFFKQYKLNLLSGLKENNTQNNLDFDVFPNPTNGDVTVIFSNRKQRVITINNAMGQEMLRFENNLLQMNVTLPNAGGFYVSVIEDGNVFTKRIIKQ